MNLINVAAVKFRKNKDQEDTCSPKETTSPDSFSGHSGLSTPTHRRWKHSNIERDLYLSDTVDKHSTCELEVDVIASDILNRLEVDANIGTNPGLAAIWEDERQRKRDLGESSQITPQQSQDSGNLSSSQDTIIVEGEPEETKPVVNLKSIQKVLSFSQSFSQQSSASQTEQGDKSLMDILASLADDSQDCSQEDVSQIEALEEEDSIMTSKPRLPNHTSIKEDEEETMEMSQIVVVEDENDDDVEDKKTKSKDRENFDLQGMDDSWTASQWFSDKDDGDDEDDDANIPQFDGASDKKSGDKPRKRLASDIIRFQKLLKYQDMEKQIKSVNNTSVGEEVLDASKIPGKKPCLELDMDVECKLESSTEKMVIDKQFPESLSIDKPNVSLRDASEGNLTPIKSQTPVSGRSPAYCSTTTEDIYGKTMDDLDIHTHHKIFANPTQFQKEILECSIEENKHLQLPYCDSSSSDLSDNDNDDEFDGGCSALPEKDEYTEVTPNDEELKNPDPSYESSDSSNSSDFGLMSRSENVSQNISEASSEGFEISEGSKDPKNRSIRRKKLTPNQRLGVAFLTTKARRKKGVSGGKLMSSLSILHQATLANLTETTPAYTDKTDDNKVNYDDVMFKLALFSPPDSDKEDSSPPMPSSPSEDIVIDLFPKKSLPNLTSESPEPLLEVKVCPEEIKEKCLKPLEIDVKYMKPDVKPHLSAEGIYETPLSSVETHKAEPAFSPSLASVGSSENDYNAGMPELKDETVAMENDDVENDDFWMEERFSKTRKPPKTAVVKLATLSFSDISSFNAARKNSKEISSSPPDLGPPNIPAYPTHIVSEYLREKSPPPPNLTPNRSPRACDPDVLMNASGNPGWTPDNSVMKLLAYRPKPFSPPEVKNTLNISEEISKDSLDSTQLSLGDGTKPLPCETQCDRMIINKSASADSSINMETETTSEIIASSSKSSHNSKLKDNYSLHPQVISNQEQYLKVKLCLIAKKKLKFLARLIKIKSLVLAGTKKNFHCQNVKTLNLNQLLTPDQSKGDTSQIDGPTPKNSFGFKITQHDLQNAKALHRHQYLTVMSIELHIETRGDLSPDPAYDPIQVIFYSVFNDVPEDEGLRFITGAIVVDKNSVPEDIQKKRIETPKKGKGRSRSVSPKPKRSRSPQPSTSTADPDTLPKSSTRSRSVSPKPSPKFKEFKADVSPKPSTSKSPKPSTSKSPQPSTSRLPQPSTSRSPQPSTSRSSQPSTSRANSSQAKQPKTLLQKSGVDNLILTYVTDEQELLEEFIQLTHKWDPDILVGYEIQMLSLGYILQRAAQLSLNICPKLSRLPDCKEGNRFSAEKDKWGADHNSEIHIAGRIVLNLWRILRHEVTLNIYDFENVAHHVLHQRIPLYSFRSLTTWFNHRTHLYRWRVIDHYTIRVKAILQIIDQLDLIGQTSEFARVFGIEFYDVLSRGSQYRVESMMLRLAKPMNFIPVSPGVHQRARMRAPECIPLTLEPDSKFYTNPVVVLDFQSLYPSIMIAYNYCFSTCLGRLERLAKAHDGQFEFGCTSLKLSPSVIRKLKDDVTISPNGVVFANESVRKGVISKMVEEILNTRIMVKKAMKNYKDDKTLYRMLNARQLGLKLIANVTYGYTGANFSGRMPCIEVGDSIVRKARESLERAIKLVEDTPRWGSRVVYGDTDSLFIEMKGKSKDEAFVIGQEIADAVTNMYPKPMKLKFEKVYLPCVLQTKKRYVGFMYETPDQKEPVFDAKGIETVRRDNCAAVSKVLERCIKLLFTTRDISQVKQYVVRQCQKLLEGKVSLQDCVFAKEYRGMSGYKPGACVPALQIARKRIRTDPRSEPRTGERVPYIIVYGSPGLPLIQLVREPRDMLADPTLRLNGTYYITKQILPPLNRLFSLIGVDVFSWYQDMPKTIRIVPQSVSGVDAKKGTISQYFATSNCRVCDEQTKQAICRKCMKEPQMVTVVLSDRIRQWERIHHRLSQVCYTCMGCQDIDQPCITLDCPILFRRLIASQDVLRADKLRQDMNKMFDF
ncbi:DNA polymerase zeta catalytic subunit [Patella vulgata]|uniref:DNA polymerase zeta catalytic subunit n=1 Tax=Patella vulgata TaxID=6465 RepID=UPI0024A9FC66|nr:DNA polymerase zeta catalytic subunit [Patella vulgata]